MPEDWRRYRNPYWTRVKIVSFFLIPVFCVFQHIRKRYKKRLCKATGYQTYQELLDHAEPLIGDSISSASVWLVKSFLIADSEGKFYDASRIEEITRREPQETFPFPCIVIKLKKERNKLMIAVKTEEQCTEIIMRLRRFCVENGNDLNTL